MNYISLFSGIEAATVAAHPLGWKPVAFAEVNPFCSALLAQHYPGIPNVGDVTAHDWTQYRGKVDLLVGGPPCQAFSVAGLRKSLGDARGNLSLEYVKAADAIDPLWIVTENVPGWLSTKDNAFGCFIAGMVGEDDELRLPGYFGSWPDCGVISGPRRTTAWRILDAQYFGVAQRRRRVFVLTIRGSRNWRCAAALFPVSNSLSGNPPPRREAGPGTARDVAASLRSSGAGTSRVGDTRGQDNVVSVTLTASGAQSLDPEMEPLVVAHSLRAEGFDASEDGTGRGTPLVPVAFDSKGTDPQPAGISPTLRAMNGVRANAGGQVAVAFDTTQITSPSNYSRPRPGDPCHPLAAGAHPPAIAFAQNQRDELRMMDVAGALAAEPGMKQQTFAIQERAVADTNCGPGGKGFNAELAYTLEARPKVQYAARGLAVRRLTPRECERLQGFSDDYTAITFRKKPAADGPRYRALGNSMAVPVMRWIFERIGAARP